MDLKDSCATSARCATRSGALETLREVERLLARSPTSLSELQRAVEHWTDPIAIEMSLRDLVEAIDPDLDPGGRLALERLDAMRVAVRARAEALRRTRATRRVRPVR